MTMTREEWVATLRNVASDLQVIADQMEHGDGGDMFELRTDAKLAVEYITHEEPHL